ncbi:SCO0930 family lipoprotein [Streptomyces sp. NPDC060194]|uniref:SCO0930 family lipoprotein n=1 Tax=Streptomyces sp. NPDC060194 TaxID=3347069 RepID=UPI0036662679
MNTWRNASLAVSAAAMLVLTTACGQDQGGESTNGQSVGNAVQQPAQDGGYDYGGGGGAAAKAEPAGQLAVLNSKELGKVLTDSNGMTLYRFDKDTAKPPKSTCEGDCAKAWPVVAAGDVTAAPGVDESLLGEVTRSDGTKQLTVGDWPMYRYAEDKEPGDVKGQGVGGTWFASSPEGKKAAASGGGGAEDGAAEEGGAEDAEAAGDLPGLSTRNDPKLGEIVVDKNGMTVYRFKKDSAWPMKTACVDDCLDNWPVVEPVAKGDTDGISQKGYVTFNRPDGLKQQTIDCWPLYTYAGDQNPGETNGQGVGGTWYAVTPEGKLVGATK